MKTYSFDVKLWATAHVTARSEKEAREAMAIALSSVDISMDHTDIDGCNVKVHEACIEDGGNDELVEIDGEAV